MKTTPLQEQDIQITAVAFSHQTEQLRFESYPRQLLYKGRQYALIEA